MAGSPFSFSIADLGSFGIGERPKGSPAALEALSERLYAKAGEGDSACVMLAAIPEMIVFQGPAGARYARYANATGNAGRGIRAAFEAAAESALLDAEKLDAAQKAWDKRLAQLVAEREEAQREADQRARELAANPPGGGR